MDATSIVRRELGAADSDATCWQRVGGQSRQATRQKGEAMRICPRLLAVLSGVSTNYRKPWIIGACALALSSLALSEPARAQCTGSPDNFVCTPGGNNYPGGISEGNTGVPTKVTLEPGVKVEITPGSSVSNVVAISTGTGPGTGLPANLIANDVTVTIGTTSNPAPGTTSALFLHRILGDATITASGVFNAIGTGNTNAIWAAVFSSAPGAIASVTYDGPTTPGTIGINAMGGDNSTDIQACTNSACGFGSGPAGSAIINATGNLKMVGGNSSFGLKANGAGNGTATVNYDGGTTDLMGGSFSTGIPVSQAL